MMKVYDKVMKEPATSTKEDLSDLKKKAQSAILLSLLDGVL